MPRSAPGNEPASGLTPGGRGPAPSRGAAVRHAGGPRGSSGFTLIEVMVVVAIIAIAAGVAGLALRDPADTQLEREAARLSALLESARTESRSLGIPVVWRPATLDDETLAARAGRAARDPSARPPQFVFAGLPRGSALPDRWLNDATRAEVATGVGGAAVVRLGPDPLIGAQRIVLRLDDRRLMLATDGLGPFVAVPLP